MTRLRKLAAGSTALLAGLLPLALAAPAGAHGAVSNPMSRVVACGPDGGRRAESAACRAAVSANGGSFDDWSNLRVPDVAGKDRELIPDGKLCSGGLDAYKGLDLARSDWPVTNLRAGADFTFTYRETIPHKGTFRMYVTKAGYSPTEPLRWSDLGSEPFLEVTDPPHKADTYVIKGKLPASRSGRHLIYTVWQNSDTPDTYYSCSDVVFGAKPVAGAPAARPSGTGSPNPAARDAGGASQAAPIPVATSTDSRLPLMAAGLGVALAACVLVGGAVVIRRRGRRPLGTHRQRG